MVRNWLGNGWNGVCVCGAGDGGLIEVQVGIGQTVLIARVTRKAFDDLGLMPGCEVFALIKSISFDPHSRG